ncbi:MAG: GNAT family N-acetyltransferase [Candidatus Hodarchaeota archaeon]
MEIKTFTMEFYDDIVNIWKKAGVSVGSSDTKGEIEKMLNQNQELFLIGKLKKRVVAVVMGAFDGRRGYVHHLAVDPEYQNRGYGRLIMDKLMNKFRELNIHKIHLFIEKYNKRVVEFYQRLGWEIRDDLIMMSIVPNESLYKSEI